MEEKNEKITVKEVLSEIWQVIVKFFRSCKSEDEFLKMPDDMRVAGTKLQIMNIGMVVIDIIFTYMVTLSNMAIESKMIFIGIMLFMIYRGRYVVKDAYKLFYDAEKEKNNLIVKKQVSLKASALVPTISNKVQKYNDKTKTYDIMTNEAVTNCLKSYIVALWKGQVIHKFQILEVICVGVMLVMAVVSNKVIPQRFLVLLLMFFGLLSFFVAAYRSVNRKKYAQSDREFRNSQDVIMNDILRMPEIAIGRDIKMRIAMFQRIIDKSNSNNVSFTNKKNKANLICTIFELFGQYALVIMYLSQIEWSTIDLATITQITASLVIVENVLNYIERIFFSISEYASIINTIDTEKEDAENILSVHYAELRKRSSSKVRDIEIPQFEIGYQEKTENDRPFKLVSEKKIFIGEGDIAILYGTSGSGKSTFMKLLTQRISLTKSDTIPSTSRFLMYDETMTFGNASIYDEIFCCREQPDFDKMQAILENLHLWNEIGRNCHNVWQWMREKKFDMSLSNGQKQRLILAKMLYWLDENVDVLVLDEATSGLDDTQNAGANASEILEYIVRYANLDMKRTIIIATHQNINQFAKKLSDDGFVFRTLNFEKCGETNTVRQLQ